jgi:hypothetical protein
MAGPNLTERQQKWFAAVQGGLERDTGRTLGEWVAIARTCPESGHRARLKWLKDEHGLLQNRASYVLSEAFAPTMSWREPDALIATLWTDPASRVVMDTIDTVASQLPETIRTARKGFTAWSRKVQYAAARPVKGGSVIFGLALEPDASARLAPAKNDGWSERLKARVVLEGPDDIDAEVRQWLKTAWERS